MRIPPFEFDRYYSAKDNVPVVHIDTMKLEENMFGPVCRIYLNDEPIWENPKYHMEVTMKVLRIDVDLSPDGRISSEEAEIIEEEIREVFESLKLDVTIESYVTGNTVIVDTLDPHRREMEV
jgi:hypothetical protein